MPRGRETPAARWRIGGHGTGWCHRPWCDGRKAPGIFRDAAESAPQVVDVLASAEGADQAGAFPGAGVPVVQTLDGLLALGLRLIAGAAGPAAVRRYGEAILRSGCDLLVTSVGVRSLPCAANWRISCDNVTERRRMSLKRTGPRGAVN